MTTLQTFKRAAKPGEKILITACDDRRYQNGDIFTVDRVDSDGDVRAKERDYLILAKEYEVIIEGAPAQFAVGQRVESVAGFHVGEVGTILEKAVESGDWTYLIQFSRRSWWKQQHTLKAVEPKVGDRVRSIESPWQGKEGIVISVRKPGFISADEGLQFKMDNGTVLWDFIKSVIVIEAAKPEPSAEPAPKFKAGDKVRSKRFTDTVYTLKQRAPQYDGSQGFAWNVVGESGWIGEDQVEAVEAVAESFKVGDRVILKSGGGNYPLYGFVNGGTYEIDALNEDLHDGSHKRDGRIRIKQNGSTGFPLPEQIELAPSEVAAVAEEAPAEPKVGDRIRKLEGFGAGSTGIVVEVRPPEYIDADKGLRFKTESGRILWAYIDQCEKIEEAAEEAAPAAEEFQPGDRIYSTEGTRSGEYGTIIRKDGANGFRVKFDSDGREAYKLTGRMELAPEVVAPEPAAQPFEVGDHVRGTASSPTYRITTDKMTRGKVTAILDRGRIQVEVIEHADRKLKEYVGHMFIVNPKYFAKIEVPQPVTEFKTGDRVRSISSGKEYVLAERRPHLDTHGYGMAFGLEGRGSWLGADQIELVEAAKPSAPVTKFAIGDRVIIGTGGWKPGAIGTVDEVNVGSFGSMAYFIKMDNPKDATREDGTIFEREGNMFKICE